LQQPRDPNHDVREAHLKRPGFKARQLERRLLPVNGSAVALPGICGRVALSHRT
jgi:hypothetical protein